ncbi:MAG: hypothetical protein ACI392_00290 [Paludibacteraceae bacterium]
MKPEISFADKMKLSAIRPLLPMVRPAVQKALETVLDEATQQLRPQNGEVEATIQCFRGADGHTLYMCTTALDDEQRIVRFIQQRTLDDLLTNLLSAI